MNKEQFDALIAWVETKVLTMTNPNDLIDSIHEWEYREELETLLVRAPQEDYDV